MLYFNSKYGRTVLREAFRRRVSLDMSGRGWGRIAGFPATIYIYLAI